ncbi:MAG TPA: hypothetical protein VML96_04645 [Egibacteraceae bacterium]|nr:hypothetical protein [Egibacteraceae bacterium]
MSTTLISKYQAAIVAIAPAALMVTLVAHPYVRGRLPNDAAIAAAVAADPTRWGLVHLGTAVASGLLLLAFLAIRSYLREAGEDRFSVLGVPFIVIGSTLFTLLPAMEFAPLAAAETGADTAGIAAAQAALTPWFFPTLLIGALTFAIGIYAFAKAIAASEILSRRTTSLVVGALAVMTLSRFVPLAAVQFYVQSAAAIAALWPLAYQMWTHPAAQPAVRTRPVTAT